MRGTIFRDEPCDTVIWVNTIYICVIGLGENVVLGVKSGIWLFWVSV